MLYHFDYGAEPGIRTTFESIENAFRWGRGEISIAFGARISGAARDAGNTPTTVLRPGLALGQITSSGLWKEYDPTATDGSEVFRGILGGPAVRATDIDGNNQNKLLAVIVAGPIIASKVYGLDGMARAQAQGRFLFDDDLVGYRLPFVRVIAKTANYTVLASDHDTIFTNQGAVGAVNFTLPTIARGLRFRFVCEADQDLTVTAATADTLVTFNDAAADSVALSTAAKRIGGGLEVVANADATKWLGFPFHWDNGTVGNAWTVAT